MDRQDIIVERVTEFSSEVADAVRSLVKQLVSDDRSLTEAEFKVIKEKFDFLKTSPDVGSSVHIPLASAS